MKLALHRAISDCLTFREALACSFACLIVLAYPYRAFPPFVYRLSHSSTTNSSYHFSMASFDFARLDPSLYTVSDVNCALDFQIMVQEFMLVVKTNPDFFEKHEKEIKDFCALLEHDDMWQVANAVIPEFRLRQ